MYLPRAALRSTRVLSTLAVVVLTGCNAKQAPPAPQPPEVAVVTVNRGSVPVTTELPGRTSAYLVAQVRARVDGIVLKRTFTEGSDVSANQRLYQIDPAPYRAMLDTALATLQKAQANLASTTALAERYKVLVAGNAVSKQDYDNAVATQGQAAADLATGKAAVETAKINLVTRCRVADQRRHRPFPGHSGRLCAGERRDALVHRSADRSDLCGPESIQRRGAAAASRRG